MSLGENPAFIVDIPEGNYETIRKEWISFLEKGTKLKVEAISNELIIKGAVKCPTKGDFIFPKICGERLCRGLIS